ncbi:hypothetical protein HDK77DRAFT_451037 [Phyllosticta capitalensis]|uniref:Secreted protein n=1 Tax=Phyllosticta capitalensis TaxID=121624 RepID=A0ABR1YIX9_9PEZI
MVCVVDVLWCVCVCGCGGSGKQEAGSRKSRCPTYLPTPTHLLSSPPLQCPPQTKTHGEKQTDMPGKMAVGRWR